MSQRPDHAKIKMKGVVDNKWKYVDGTNEEYNNFRRQQAEGIEDAVKRGTASNISVAFPTPPKDFNK